MTTKSLKKSSNLLDLPSVFDDFFAHDLMRWPFHTRHNGNSFPAANIKETDKNFELDLAVPGMNKTDFKVELNNDMLTISAERETKKEEKDEQGYSRREFSYQSFSRSFSLPEQLVQSEKITASYKDGILHITVPKAEPSKLKGSKQIQIS